jgi:hypothetical protein
VGGKVKEIYRLENPDVDGKTILKWISNKQDG